MWRLNLLKLQNEILALQKALIKKGKEIGFVTQSPDRQHWLLNPITLAGQDPSDWDKKAQACQQMATELNSAYQSLKTSALNPLQDIFDEAGRENPNLFDTLQQRLSQIFTEALLGLRNDRINKFVLKVLAADSQIPMPAEVQFLYRQINTCPHNDIFWQEYSAYLTHGIVLDLHKKACLLNNPNLFLSACKQFGYQPNVQEPPEEAVEALGQAMKERKDLDSRFWSNDESIEALKQITPEQLKTWCIEHHYAVFAKAFELFQAKETFWTDFWRTHGLLDPAPNEDEKQLQERRKTFRAQNPLLLNQALQKAPAAVSGSVKAVMAQYRDLKSILLGNWVQATGDDQAMALERSGSTANKAIEDLLVEAEREGLISKDLLRLSYLGTVVQETRNYIDTLSYHAKRIGHVSADGPEPPVVQFLKQLATIQTFINERLFQTLIASQVQSYLTEIPQEFAIIESLTKEVPRKIDYDSESKTFTLSYGLNLSDPMANELLIQEKSQFTVKIQVSDDLTSLKSCDVNFDVNLLDDLTISVAQKQYLSQHLNGTADRAYLELKQRKNWQSAVEGKLKSSEDFEILEKALKLFKPDDERAEQIINYLNDYVKRIYKSSTLKEFDDLFEVLIIIIKGDSINARDSAAEALKSLLIGNPVVQLQGGHHVPTVVFDRLLLVLANCPTAEQRQAWLSLLNNRVLFTYRQWLTKTESFHSRLDQQLQASVPNLTKELAEGGKGLQNEPVTSIVNNGLAFLDNAVCFLEEREKLKETMPTAYLGLGRDDSVNYVNAKVRFYSFNQVVKVQNLFRYKSAEDSTRIQSNQLDDLLQRIEGESNFPLFAAALYKLKNDPACELMSDQQITQQCQKVLQEMLVNPNVVERFNYQNLSGQWRPSRQNNWSEVELSSQHIVDLLTVAQNFDFDVAAMNAFAAGHLTIQQNELAGLNQEKWPRTSLEDIAVTYELVKLLPTQRISDAVAILNDIPIEQTQALKDYLTRLTHEIGALRAYFQSQSNVKLSFLASLEWGVERLKQHALCNKLDKVHLQPQHFVADLQFLQDLRFAIEQYSAIEKNSVKALNESLGCFETAIVDSINAALFGFGKDKDISCLNGLPIAHWNELTVLIQKSPERDRVLLPSREQMYEAIFENVQNFCQYINGLATDPKVHLKTIKTLVGNSDNPIRDQQRIIEFFEAALQDDAALEIKKVFLSHEVVKYFLTETQEADRKATWEKSIVHAIFKDKESLSIFFDTKTGSQNQDALSVLRKLGESSEDLLWSKILDSQEMANEVGLNLASLVEHEKGFREKKLEKEIEKIFEDYKAIKEFLGEEPIKAVESLLNRCQDFPVLRNKILNKISVIFKDLLNVQIGRHPSDDPVVTLLASKLATANIAIFIHQQLEMAEKEGLSDGIKSKIFQIFYLVNDVINKIFETPDALSDFLNSASDPVTALKTIWQWCGQDKDLKLKFKARLGSYIDNAWQMKDLKPQLLSRETLAFVKAEILTENKDGFLRSIVQLEEYSAANPVRNDWLTSFWQDFGHNKLDIALLLNNFVRKLPQPLKLSSFQQDFIRSALIQLVSSEQQKFLDIKEGGGLLISYLGEDSIARSAAIAKVIKDYRLNQSLIYSVLGQDIVDHHSVALKAISEGENVSQITELFTSGLMDTLVQNPGLIYKKGQFPAQFIKNILLSSENLESFFEKVFLNDGNKIKEFLEKLLVWGKSDPDLRSFIKNKVFSYYLLADQQSSMHRHPMVKTLIYDKFCPVENLQAKTITSAQAITLKDKTTERIKSLAELIKTPDSDAKDEMAELMWQTLYDLTLEKIKAYESEWWKSSDRVKAVKALRNKLDELNVSPKKSFKKTKELITFLNTASLSAVEKDQAANDNRWFNGHIRNQNGSRFQRMLDDIREQALITAVRMTYYQRKDNTVDIFPIEEQITYLKEMLARLDSNLISQLGNYQQAQSVEAWIEIKNKLKAIKSDLARNPSLSHDKLAANHFIDEMLTKIKIFTAVYNRHQKFPAKGVFKVLTIHSDLIAVADNRAKAEVLTDGFGENSRIEKAVVLKKPYADKKKRRALSLDAVPEDEGVNDIDSLNQKNSGRNSPQERALPKLRSVEALSYLPSPVPAAASSHVATATGQIIPIPRSENNQHELLEKPLNGFR